MTKFHITGYVQTKFSRTVSGDTPEECMEKLKAMSENDIAFVYSDQKIVERHPYLDQVVNVEFDGEEKGITIEDESGEEIEVDNALWLHDLGIRQ